MVGLLEEVDQVSHDAPIAAVEEGSRDTRVTSTAGTTDTVHIVVDVGGQVIVHNVRDVGNIETTGSDSSCNKNGATAVTEHVERALTLTLGAVAVDRRGWEALVDEEVGQRIRHALGLDEDQSQAGTVGVEDIKQDGALVDILNVLNLLSDVLRGGTDTTNGEEDVVFEEVAGKHLNIAGEGGGEHESLAALHTGHVLTLHNSSNLRLETHVKHAVSLVKNEVLDVLQGDATTLYEVDQTSGSSHQEIASTLDLAKLRTNVGSTVDDARPHPGTVGKLPRLIVDLRDQLTGGCEDERCGVGLALTTKATLTDRVGRWAGLVGLREDGEEETTSLSRTSLSASHQVTAAHDDGDGVLLHWSWVGVSSKRDVGDQVVVQRRVGEGKDRLRNVLTGSLNGDVVVLLKVDTGVLLGWIIVGTEELALNARVGRARHVFSVLPATIPRAPSLASAATATSATSSMRTGTGIRVGVEGLRASPEPIVAGRGAIPLGTVVVRVVAVDESVSI